MLLKMRHFVSFNLISWSRQFFWLRVTEERVSSALSALKKKPINDSDLEIPPVTMVWNGVCKLLWLISVWICVFTSFNKFHSDWLWQFDFPYVSIIFTCKNHRFLFLNILFAWCYVGLSSRVQFQSIWHVEPCSMMAYLPRV